MSGCKSNNFPRSVCFSSVKHAPGVLGVAANPPVIRSFSDAVLVLDLQSGQIKWVLVVGQMGPEAASGWLVKVPMSPFHRFDGQFYSRPFVRHFNVEARQRRPGLLAVRPLGFPGGEFFNLDVRKPFASLMLCVVKNAALREGDMLDVPAFPRSSRACRHRG